MDHTGTLAERYAYDEYGRPLIRENAGRGDCESNGILDATNMARATAVKNGTKWDPRVDMDDDGDVDQDDLDLLATKSATWFPAASPTVAEAFSDYDNPFMFQGRPRYRIAAWLPDTAYRGVTDRWRSLCFSG